MPEGKSSSTFDTVYKYFQENEPLKETYDTNLYHSIITKMSDDEKRLSFLNRYFIFRKISDIEEEELYILNEFKLRYKLTKYKDILKHKIKDWDKIKLLLEADLVKKISSELWVILVAKFIDGFTTNMFNYDSSTKLKDVKVGTKKIRKIRKIRKISKVRTTDATILHTPAAILDRNITEFNRFYGIIINTIDNDVSNTDSFIEPSSDVDSEYMKFKLVLTNFLKRFHMLKKDSNVPTTIKQQYDKIQLYLNSKYSQTD